MVKVSATDKSTGKQQHVTIQAASGLSDDEVQRLQREAEEHASEDAAKRESVEARNTGDSLAYSAEKMLRDNAEVVEGEPKEKVEAAIKALRDSLAGEDTAAIKEQTEALSAAMQEVGAAIYGAQQAANAPGGGGESGPNGATGGGAGAGEGEPDTVEGEFREV